MRTSIEKKVLESHATMKRVLNGYIHYNISGDKVDVREVDSRYAEYLINWYKQAVDSDTRKLLLLGMEELVLSEDEFNETTIIRTLREIADK